MSAGWGRERSIYKTKRWRGLRKQVLREQPWCQQEGCRAMATEVDHIVPYSKGGQPWDRDNLQALCKPHHSSKTAKEVWG